MQQTKPPGHTNGTVLHAKQRRSRRPRGLQALVAGGLLLALIGMLGGWRASRELDALEALAPARLASAGSLVMRFLPGLVSNPARGSSAATDPYLSREYLATRRVLQGFAALTGVGIGLALFGSVPRRRDLQGTGELPASRRPSVWTDFGALVLLASLAYAGFVIFETG
ncbi:MAG: hypothetical protein HYX52_09625 [Chloroflexi bacterium]|nr:hypothetical protein [Chloroflexota bacterium]